MTNLTVTGLNEAEQSLERQRKFLDLGLGPKLQQIGLLAEADLKQNFESEGSFYGSPWPQLKEATVDHRLKLIEKFGLAISPSHPILVNWGKFKASIVDPASKEHEKRIDKFTVTIATTHRKPGMAETQAEIVEKGLGTNPVRKVTHPAGASPAAMEKMMKLMEAHAAAVEKL